LGARVAGAEAVAEGVAAAGGVVGVGVEGVMDGTRENGFGFLESSLLALVGVLESAVTVAALRLAPAVAVEEAEVEEAEGDMMEDVGGRMEPTRANGFGRLSAGSLHSSGPSRIGAMDNVRVAALG
jgi:hypothetical protein